MSSGQPGRRPGGVRLNLLLAAAFVLVIVVPVVVLSVIPPAVNARQAQVRLVEDLGIIADSQEAALLAWVERTRADLQEITDNTVTRPLTITLLSGETFEATHANFSGYVASLNNPFEEVMLADLDGVVRGTDHADLLGLDVNGESWYQAALGAPAAEVRISGPLYDARSDEQSLYFSMPVANYAGEIIGVIGGRTSTAPLAEALASVPLTAVTGDTYLLRAGQQYVVPPRLGEVGPLATDEIAPEAVSGESGARTWRDHRGERVSGVYRWIAPLNVALVVKQDVSETAAASRNLSLLGLGLGVVTAVLALGLALVIARRTAGALSRASEVARQIAGGELALQVPGSRLVEVDQLAEAFNGLTARLRELITRQEEIIAARTRALEITARMGQAIASETDFERLLQSTIEMIRDQLGYYHAQVFLLDDLKQNAVLRASMGEAGREMLARHHKLGVGSASVVGQAAARREPALASDTQQAIAWRPNPLLPDTRAELGIPLQLGDQVLGVLDIQATDPDVFDEATIGLLQTVADQLAVAIRNAQLLEEKEGLLSASVELTQMLTQESWAEYERQRREGSLGFQYDLNAVKPLDEADPANGDGGLNLPIALRGTVIGQLNAQLADGRSLTETERQLVAQVLDRVALAIDNARLIEQTQRSLQETNRLYEATQNIVSANSVDELITVLVDLATYDAVDRAFVFMLESAGAEPTPWVEVMARWLRDPDDPLHALPDRLRVDTHPLLRNVENIPVGEFVLNNVETTELDPAMKEAFAEYGVRAAAIYAISPGITGMETLGWLVLHSTRIAEAFSEADTRYLETLVDQAATALEGLRLFEQTQARARRLQATNEVSRAASSILDPDVLLPLIVDRVSEAFGYYHAQIFLLDEAREWAVLRASTGEVGQELLRRGHRLAVGSRSVIGQATATGDPVVIGDIERDPVHHRNELLPYTRAEMALPLVSGNRVIGALDVQSTQPGAFDVEAQAILQSLADQIAVTLENATLFQEIQERVAELTTVNVVSQTVSRAETLDDLFNIVSEQMTERFGVRQGYLRIAGAGTPAYTPIFLVDGVRRPAPPGAPLGSGIEDHVLSTRQVLFVNENVAETLRELGIPLPDRLPKSLLITPLLLGDEVIGLMGVYNYEREHVFDETHVRQLTTLAAYIAVKIRNAELLEQAQQRADELGFLFQVTRTAVSSTDMREALGAVADTLLRELAPAEAVTFFLADEVGALSAEAAVGYGRDFVARGVRLKQGEGLAGAAALAGQSLLVHDAHQGAGPAGSVDSRTRAAMAVPLLSGGQTVGVIMVESAQPGVFSQNEIGLLEGASSTLTAVIQNARLLEEISRTNAQLRELDMLKSQFLANMSHELRTPLNSIIGFSRVILKGIDGPLTDLQEQDLTTIYNSGQHLLGLINNILDLSKIEAGKMEIQPEYMDAEETIDTVISTSRGLVKDRPVEIIRDVEDGLPEIYGDPMRVRQVLLNLASNAAKFTQEGSITVRARRKPYNPETGEPPRVQFDVADTGIGISPTDMSKLFQAFSQVDGSTTRQVGGTGLGLTISQEFVEMMGGRIWVESEVGKGSTFSFTVPLYPPGSPESEIVMTSHISEDCPLVLAVDDEPGVLDLYARYLEKGGYGVVGVDSAMDLLDYVREIEPAAVILDLNLPGKSGWAAVQELKYAPETAHIPIIVCSIDEPRAHPLAAQLAAYLTKPVIEVDLLDALDAALAAPPPLSLQDVLLVDADQAFAGLVADTLAQAYGCRVRAMPTGLGGLEALYEQHPDLLILDPDLPDMDGYGLLAALRTQPGWEHLPVVVMTDQPPGQDMQARLAEPYTVYLETNGREPDHLLDELSAVLGELGVG